MPTINFIWDDVSDNVLVETDENNQVTTTYIRHPEKYGEVFYDKQANRFAYYHYDGNGSTRKLTGANQAVTKTYIFTGFGELVASPGVGSTPFAYKGAAGYYTNPVTNDIYVRARTYEPMTGRWLSRNRTYPIVFLLPTYVYRFDRITSINCRTCSGDSTPESRLGRSNDLCEVQWEGFIESGATPFEYFVNDLPCPGDCIQLPNLTMYGCYCGLGNPPSGKTPLGPIDPLDACCQDHDSCYEANACPPYVQGGQEHAIPKCKECDRKFCKCARIAPCNRHPVNPPRRKAGEPPTRKLETCERFKQLILTWFDCEFRFCVKIPRLPDRDIWKERRKRVETSQ